MLNTIVFGNRLARKRREAGLTQETLVERVGDGIVSLSTLKRLESGKGHIDMVRVVKICGALGCSLQDLIEDDTLESALLNYFGGPEDNVKEYVEYRLMHQQLFYPEAMSWEYYECHPIKTLLQLLIYLPLFDEEDLWDIVLRIDGFTFGFEGYVLDLLRILYEKIPDSEAKRYADYEASKCTYQYFMKHYTTDSVSEIEQLSDVVWPKERFSQRDAYVELVKKKFKHRWR